MGLTHCPKNSHGIEIESVAGTRCKINLLMTCGNSEKNRLFKLDVPIRCSDLFLEMDKIRLKTKQITRTNGGVNKNGERRRGRQRRRLRDDIGSSAGPVFRKTAKN